MPSIPETPKPDAVLRTLLISDLVGSTRLVRELDDTAAPASCAPIPQGAGTPVLSDQTSFELGMPPQPVDQGSFPGS